MARVEVAAGVCIAVDVGAGDCTAVAVADDSTVAAAAAAVPAAEHRLLPPAQAEAVDKSEHLVVAAVAGS